MMKKYESKILLLTVFMSFMTSGIWVSGQNTMSTASRPTIIFILADDWGYGDLGCYGNADVTTPNLDKLASQGTRYTQFHVTSGVCSPSRSSILTGHFPARHRIHGHFAGNGENSSRNMPNWLDENLPVYLPKQMREAGYVTAHIGKWHLGGGGAPNGDTGAPEPKVYGYDETRVWNGNGPTWKGDQHWPTTRYMDNDTLWIQNSSKLAVDESIDFLRRNRGKSPMFLNIWLKDPHTPLAPSARQRKPFKGLEPDKETYYSVLADADYHIGRLIDSLAKMGLDDNTLLIFTSDNGPANYAPARIAGSTAGLKGRKTDIFEGGVNVPLIIRWPGHVAAGAVDTLSVLSAVDLLPTFCELAGNKLPKEFKPDGESFANLLQKRPFKRSKPLFWEWRFPYLGTDRNRQNSWANIAVRDGDWKLIANNSINRIELYMISVDPFETKNLANDNPEKVKELLNKWNEWKSGLPD
ncbi:sulfatase family protein [Spirosoma endbachense]|uniref:Sulfatase-like hydrolase/transferase n=1 Tax=Spirosoma endbachense TaxID=2666025 RepID=A0A6P1VSE0_9BACT|nr:sulfatase-like hydrolase/transferase [Spirosoma endbachense]QHV94539.1 sulfatase-like hydrolase/transferase [Spirosoma endbachense]